MKKSLIALAVLGAFSGAALAQSNVTLYGILDVNYQNNDPDVGDAVRGINGGHWSGNRLGVRGTEALGGGWNVVFDIEAGFNIDTGTSGQSSAACTSVVGTPLDTICTGAAQNRLFGRQAWAGLSSRFGTLVAGRVPNLSSGTGDFDIFGQVDPGGTGFGDSGFQATMSSANSLRLDNNILYKSPTFAGFTLGGSYSFNASGSEQANTDNNVSVAGFGGSWGAGPFYAVVTYDIFNIPGASDDQTHLQIGGSFDLKFLKIGAAYAIEDEQRVLSTVGTTSGADADAWAVGLTIPLFGGNILAWYQDRDGDPVTLATGVVDERDLTVWAIAYTYPLSRRTQLYVNYSDKDGEKTLQGNTTLDRKQATVGMRHLF
jgi:predicted porin